MVYKAEKWVPRPKPIEAFLISVENSAELKTLLNATDVRTAYMKGGKILFEWTMMHRETFTGLVGQFIIRNDRGEFVVLDKSELRADFEPYVERTERVSVAEHPELGTIVGVDSKEGTIKEVLFKLPDGSPATFVPKTEVRESNESKENRDGRNNSPKPGPNGQGNHQNKGNNNGNNRG